MEYYVWITAISDAFTDNIVGRLIRRNWQVKCLGGTLALKSKDNMSVVLAFSMSKQPKDDKPENEITQAVAMDEVFDVLHVLGVKYHSLIVAGKPAGCTWRQGNLTVSELERLEEKTKKAVN